MTTTYSTAQSTIERVAGNVRAALTFNRGSRLTAGQLQAILECAPQRARQLYNGRAAFEPVELRMLSAYFDCDPSDWLTERGVRAPFARDYSDWIAVAKDRLVTARESAGA